MKAKGARTAASANQPWHTLAQSQVVEILGTSVHGLDTAEVAARLSRYGPNALDETPPPSPLLILLHQFQSPLIYILLVAAVVALALEEYIDAGVIGAVLALNAVIGFTQEYRAEYSVRALMRLVSPKARVVRGGREREIESRELVPGDLVLLETGVRVPADLRLISATALMIDESLLTGESVPVTKTTATLAAPELALGDRLNMAYAGSIVTRGRGRGYVTATGAETELGAIATQIRTRERAETPLQRRMNRFAAVIGIACTVGSIGVFALGLVRGESIADMFMVAVAMAVAVVPEGLPVVFTITLALGVRRMARHNAIIRRLPAVETLGSTTVIGSDKTGTLTENRMKVQRIWAGGRSFSLAEGGSEGIATLFDDRGETSPAEHRPLYLTLLAGVLASEANVTLTSRGYESSGDPTEAALLMAAANLGIEVSTVRSAYAVEAEIPFEPERQFSASFRARDERHYLFVKGAPERVLAMSDKILLDDGPAPIDRAAVLAAAHAFASKGLRVLAMAYRDLPSPPTAVEEPMEPEALTFLGLQGSMDPPRAGVREAIAACRDAGIRVIMITGDHAVTAQAVGKAIGIADNGAALTGEELSRMADDELEWRVRQASIYARVAPEHKLRVVEALQRQGEVVAVTGDGVNDAPALKAAAIGIAMGKSGTDVAREAADMVLADDNFVSIYAAVKEGRVTFDNLRKVTFFLISTGAASLVAIITALLLGWPLPFLPAQLLWLNLVTNGLQDVALAFEPGEPGVLEKPPRPPSEGIVSALLWERTLVAGLVIAIGTLALFRWELASSVDIGKAQTVALTTMVVFQLFHVGNCRSESRSVFVMSPFSNRFLFLATAGSFLIHGLALYAPWTQFVLRVQPIEPEAWVRIFFVGASIIAAMELHKWLRSPRGT